MDRQVYSIRKFGSLAYSQHLEARVAAAGAEDGIEFRFDQIKRTPNTVAAHRHAEDVGDNEVLKWIGVQSGLDAGRLEAVDRRPARHRGVDGRESEARARGVTGAPTFFVDGGPITSGAQKAEAVGRRSRTAGSGLRSQHDARQQMTACKFQVNLVTRGLASRLDPRRPDITRIHHGFCRCEWSSRSQIAMFLSDGKQLAVRLAD
jgi:hypothetical protein